MRELGGVVPAIKENFFQREIAEASFRYQSEVESRQRVVVGVNRYELEDEAELDILRIDPALERKQIERVQALRADPDGARERELELIEREADAFQVELMGKDGGMKARWDNLVGVSELWAKIDATPTRRRALREAAAAAPQTTRLL